MTKKTSVTADEVAKHFIYLASRKVVGDNQGREGVTNLKLQKVLYFAQAYCLSKLDRSLFSDSIEAWEYGPVVPSVYREYKGNGSDSIIMEEDTSSLPDGEKKIVERVWDVFGGYSAGRLVDITHAHAPWKDAYNAEDKVIPHAVLKDYYGPLLNK